MGRHLHWSIILAALFLFFGQLSIGLAETAQSTWRNGWLAGCRGTPLRPFLASARAETMLTLTASN
jgi:hypothetical protein